MSRSDKAFEENWKAQEQYFKACVRRFRLGFSLEDDMLQRVRIAAWKAWKGFEERCTFRSWVFQIMINQVRDHCKKEKYGRYYQKTVPFPNHIQEDRHIWLLQDPDECYDFEIREDVATALENLPLHYQRIILLYFLQEKSQEECSEILGIPIGTVKSRINRGRSMLRHFLFSYH